MTAPAFCRTSVGDFTVTALHDGTVSRDRGDGFICNADGADVEAVFSQAGFGPGRLVITFTGFMIVTPQHLALIDPGFGENGPPTAGRIAANFKAAGHAPGDVDRILISHFHGDHISGLLTSDGAPSWPNARVLVPVAEWDFWMSDEEMGKAPEALRGNFANVRRIFGTLGERVERFVWGDEVLPGITAIPGAGHTPGMTAFDIVSGTDRLRFMADVCNNPTVFARQPDWHAAFDMNGDQATDTRRRQFSEVADANIRLAFFHAPFPAIGHIARDGNAFCWLPDVWM
ncbi:MBL fold metallo-hydrolase [Salipiger sp.]|uniref:MBL fold metallo-hydrolase n=1 Tax=Salipiger sp. TaxID=2078585 RepID=UPI003A983790